MSDSEGWKRPDGPLAMKSWTWWQPESQVRSKTGLGMELGIMQKGDAHQLKAKKTPGGVFQVQTSLHGRT